MNDPRRAGHKVSAILALALTLSLFASAPALAADTYQINLFQGGTLTGAGSFSFDNPGANGGYAVSVADLQTNGSSTIGPQSFTAGDLNINARVTTVNFNDGKTPPNQITGNFVEGLNGNLRTAYAAIAGCGVSTDRCRYVIDFSSTFPGTNPAGFTKTYTIARFIRQPGTDLQDSAFTPVNGTYSVSNTKTIPEPGSLALLGIGFAALAWSAKSRRPWRGAST